MDSNNKENIIKDKLALIPHQSGVYRFLNSEGKVIYVGKAKDLHKRVSQYFMKSMNHSAKTLKLVDNIDNILFTVVDNECEALLLENNLIKTLKPKYNILLKDDKTYPWIAIKNEPFPRIFITRHLVKDGSKYYGPYSKSLFAKQIVDLLHQLYPLRTCNLPLSEEKIEGGLYKKCLKYHLGNCKAPCIGEVSAKEYEEWIEQAKRIFKGDSAWIQNSLQEGIKEAVASLNFERAQELKTKLEAITLYRSKSVIVNASISDVDVFSIVREGPWAYTNFMRVMRGSIVQSQNMTIRTKLDESDNELLALFIGEIMNLHGSLSKEILVPCIPFGEWEEFQIHVPQRGDKLELLNLSLRNAKAWMIEQQQLQQQKDPEQLVRGKLLQLQKDLGTKLLPRHIECFDNSNIMGTNPVAACVVFRNAKPSKKDYRHFLVKTVVGANDYASMVEIVTRRYTRLIEEAGGLEAALKPDSIIPQLVVIDGGKGQLTCAREAICSLGLQDRISLVALAERMEEIYRPGDPYPLCLDKNSSSLKILMQIRDEAHRFGITHHRNRRSSNFATSKLTQIKGIGEATCKKLLTRFHSLKQLKEAGYEQWKEAAGEKVANLLRDNLQTL